MDQYYDDLQFSLDDRKKEEEEYVKRAISEIEAQSEVEKPSQPGAGGASPAPQEAAPAAAEEEEPKSTRAVGYDQKRGSILEGIGGLFGEQGRRFGEFVDDMVNAPAKGVLDTVFDAAGLIPGLKGLDAWWDKAQKPTYDKEHGLVTATRKISAIVIPSIIGGGAITQGGKAVAGASKINALARLEKAGTIAAHIGADVGVTAISSQSVEDENLGEALEDWLGVNIPWATRAGDSPDVRRQKHILEAAGMNVASELLQGIFALRRGTKVVPTNQAAAEVLDGAEEVVPVVANNAEEVRAAAKAAEKVDPRIAKLQAEKSIYEESLANHKLAQDSGDVAMQLDDQTLTLYADRLNKIDEQLAKLDSDPVVRAMDDAAEATAREQTDEAIRRVNADPNGEKGYDAFINTPAEPESRAVINTDVNPHLAAVDHAVIQRNIGTTAGRARAAVTNGQLKYMQAAPGSQRAEDLKQFFDSDVADGLAAVVDGKRLSAADVKSSVDRLVESVFDMGDNGMDDYVRTIQGMKDNVYQGIKYFGEENWVIASQAFRKAFDQVFDPNVKRASAIVTQQMGDDIADTARAANIIGEVADTSRQQEIVLERLETLASEIRVNQYIAGRTLEYKKLVKNGKPEAVAEFLEETGSTMAAQVDKAKEGAKKLVNTLRAIKEKNPELLKPFMYAYDLTNGKVDEIHKLNRFAEQHVGLFNKMIYDDMPEVPSMLLEQLNAVRYNNVLSGLSAIRAAAGNATNLVMKPVNSLVGSLARGKFDEFKRIHAVYGGVHETFTRAMKHMGNEWKFALDDYDGAMMRGRADLNLAKSNDIEFMESMADVWRQNGEIGKVAKWNITKSLKWWNGKLINRYGTTAMYALDGFVKSAMATASARAQAYDDLIRSGAHQLDNFQQAFIAKSGQLYDEAFDSTGLLTDKAAKIASGEISLNLDNKLVSSLEGMMKQYPALRTVFMFPRTGANALELSWSYMPSAPFNAAIGKQRKVFKAVTREMKMEALMEHGIEEFSEAAFEAIKSEYIGRQVMGGSIMMGIGMMAFNGQVTGNGPQDAAEKRRMIEMGWQPKSIRVGDRWVSYQGLEPFDTLMSLTADVIYQANRVDQSVTEDWMRKLSFAISANLTSKTFLSGLQPLTDIIAGNNEAALARFTANFADSMLPLSGARHVFARMVKPQLQDVENDFMAYMQNYNRYLPAADAALEDYIDVYTGKPINNFSPMESTWNALMPFFKTSFGTEPWREWLLNTGWDGLQKPRVNVNNGEPLDPSTRQWINNYVATYGGLAQRIEEMRTRPDGFWDKKMKEYSKLRGMQDQSAVPIKEWVVHQELDRIHDEAFQEAWRQWEIKNADEANIGLFKESTKRAMNIGDAVTAERSIQSTQNLIDYYKK